MYSMIGTRPMFLWHGCAGLYSYLEEGLPVCLSVCACRCVCVSTTGPMSGTLTATELYGSHYTKYGWRHVE